MARYGQAAGMAILHHTPVLATDLRCQSRRASYRTATNSGACFIRLSCATQSPIRLTDPRWWLLGCSAGELLYTRSQMRTWPSLGLASSRASPKIMGKDWPLLDWYRSQRGNLCWMVCRAGHLWEATIPYADELYGRAKPTFLPKLYSTKSVTKCPTCTMLKQTGARIRGITKVCPDYAGKIRARMLNNGTVEHHDPAAVAAVYSDEAAKAWRACLALAHLIAGRSR